MAKSGDVYHVLGNTITMKVSATDTNGALAMFVEEAPADSTALLSKVKSVGVGGHLIAGAMGESW